MTTTTENAVSAAGLDQGRQAFQEFLLAGERHVTSGFTRPGAEERFANFYAAVPKQTQTAMKGYFERQSKLDLSQRVALLGDYTKLRIADPLTPKVSRRVRRLHPSIRSELNSLRYRQLTRGADRLPSTTGIDEVLAESLGRAPGWDKLKLPENPVRYVDLLAKSVTIEKSQDDTWKTRATDTVHLAVTTIAEDGTVSAGISKFGSIHEGDTKNLNDAVIGSIKLSTASTIFPRTVSFKVDAVEKDNGKYKDVLDEATKYIKHIVTEEMIASGLFLAGAWVGIPIPPQLAIYIASYLKGWYDEAIDWLISIIMSGDEEDDVLGTELFLITLSDAEFEFERRNIWLNYTQKITGKSPLKGWEFTRVFSGDGGRWKVVFQWQLR